MYARGVVKRVFRGLDVCPDIDARLESSKELSSQSS